MLAEFVSKKLNARNFHYSWIIVLVTFYVMLSTACALGAPGVLMKPVASELGFSIADISGALSLRFVLFGLVAPFAAVLIRNHGEKLIVSLALILIFSGLCLSQFAKDKWQLVITWGIMVGVGAGMTAIVLGATVANKWFSKRRGLIVGLLAASGATGQLIFLPIIAKVSETYGWRPALSLVCVLLILALALVGMFMRNHPSDLGLLGYGETQSAPTPQGAQIGPIEALLEGAKSPVFWVLFFTFFICGASTNGLVQTHFVSFCGDMGMLAVASASVLAMMGVFDMFGTIGSGYLTDRVDPRFLLAGYYFFRGLSLLYLPHANFTIAGLTPFAVFYGLDWIATVPPTLRLTTNEFGPQKAAVMFGWIFAGHQLGAAAIAFFAGWVRTQYETYIYAFQIAGALCVLAAILSLFASSKNNKPQTSLVNAQ